MSKDAREVITSVVVIFFGSIIGGVVMIWLMAATAHEIRCMDRVAEADRYLCELGQYAEKHGKAKK